MERQRFLLDTNMLVGPIRNAPWARRAMSENGLNGPQTLPTTSVVCHGEIMAISERNRWEAKKRAILTELLYEIPAVGIKQQPILRAYARIDAWSCGKSIVDQPAPPPRPARKMDQNDMWIAATAQAIGAILLSADRDFEHLNGIRINHVYVDQREPPPRQPSRRLTSS